MLSPLERSKEALEAADSAIKILSSLPEGGRPIAMQAAALHERGQALQKLGDGAGAIVALESALALRRAHDAPGRLWHEKTALALADVRASRGRTDLAKPLRAAATRLRHTCFRVNRALHETLAYRCQVLWTFFNDAMQLSRRKLAAKIVALRRPLRSQRPPPKSVVLKCWTWMPRLTALPVISACLF